MAMRPKKKTEELKMKIFNLGIKVAAAVGLTALISVSAMAAGITDTKHNLSSTQTSANASFDGTAEICVFCHTPHGAASEAPLWNRVVGVASDYTAYSSTTLDGTVSLTGSPSLACLSCHDGQQAMNTVINATSSATSYNYTAGGAAMSGTWSGAGALGIIIGTENTVPNLGTDLQNDHPVAIPYAGGGLSTSSPTTFAFADPDFRDPSTGNIGSQNVWWLEFDPTNSAGTADTTGGIRTKSDIILYTRGGTGYVECATCHDPHSDNQQFLRAENNNGSQVCLACHVK